MDIKLDNSDVLLAIKDLSLHRIQDICSDRFTEVSPEDAQVDKASWHTSIDVKGDGFDLSIATLYKLEDIVEVSKKLLGNDLEDPEEVARSLVGELCNLVAGGLKAVFYEQGISSNICLPSTRPNSTTSDGLNEGWILRSEKTNILFEIRFKIYDYAALSAFSYSQDRPLESNHGVEFL